MVDKENQLEDVTTTEPHHIPCVATLRQGTYREERLSVLSCALDLDQLELPQMELNLLQGLVVEFGDLFALDSSELGRPPL